MRDVSSQTQIYYQEPLETGALTQVRGMRKLNHHSGGEKSYITIKMRTL
jgi:hypothetical protein